MTETLPKDKLAKESEKILTDLKEAISDTGLMLADPELMQQTSDNLVNICQKYQETLSKTITNFAPDEQENWVGNLSDLILNGQKLTLDIFLNTAHQPFEVEPQKIDPLGAGQSWMNIWGSFMQSPQTIIDQNLSLWHNYMDLCTQTMRKLSGEEVKPFITPPKGDRRFKSEIWNEHVFDFIKQCYLMISDSLLTAVEKAAEQNFPDNKSKEKERTLFFAKQFIDAMSPSNFLMTNPEVLQETFKTGGKNLVNGLQNLLRDIERGQGRLRISQTDPNAFKIGVDLAATPGKVVFRNDLIELLHYTPTTEKTYAIPLLILPPFINKFYILDMRPENSMIKWLVDQGFSVFVASWKNPTSDYSSYSFDNYINNGLMAAINAITQMTGQKKISAVGYCIAGTMLTMALSKMKKMGKDVIANATYFASQADFSDAGELSLFVDEERIQSYIDIMKAAGGVLEGTQMADTFNMLRANDLVWSFVVNNYLLGKDPFPFDLLYWNSDTTRLPMQLQIDYLKSCYLNNDLSNNRFKIGNMLIEPNLIDIPMYIQSSKEDHIAPAASVYRGAQLYKGMVKFITAGSGHIAGVINHPAKNKYQYWTNDKLPTSFDDWFETATEHAGSWWLDWKDWLVKQSGEQIKAFTPPQDVILGDAPGTYVRE